MSDGPETSRLLAALRLTANALQELGISWALVGGLAVSVRADPRFTRDIDLAVSVADDGAAESLVRDLKARGFHLVLSLEQAALGRLATVRLLPPGEPAEGVVVDLLFASSGCGPTPSGGWPYNHPSTRSRSTFGRPQLAQGKPFDRFR